MFAINAELKRGPGVCGAPWDAAPRPSAPAQCCHLWAAAKTRPINTVNQRHLQDQHAVRSLLFLLVLLWCCFTDY